MNVHFIHRQGQPRVGMCVCIYIHVDVFIPIFLFTNMLNSVCVGEQSCQFRGRWCT